MSPPRHPALIRRRAVASLGAAALWPGLLRAQVKFPEKPIQLIVPFGPGGIADITARTVADAMASRLGQPIVIDNRPSAGSITASQAVATARPDGHTLLLMSNGNAVSVGLFRKLPYDTLRDFAGISTLGFFDLGVFVATGSPIANLADLVARAKQKPAQLNIGTIAVGSTQHLAARLFATVAGIDVLLVPYKASPAVVMALRTGEIDAAFEIVGPMMSQLQSGVVRALAVSSSQRSPGLPQVPTVIEAGVPGYDVASWNGLAAPAGTPREVIAVLNGAAREAVASAAVQEKLGKLGVRAAASSPAELEGLLAGEIKRWGEVIRAAKIQPV